MGSVKDLKVISDPTENEAGVGAWDFSCRYSIWDLGEMPDHIPKKGPALCMMAAWNFEQLEKLGIKTHYKGVVDGAGNLRKTTDLAEPSNTMVVQLARVFKPRYEDKKYDYSWFTEGRGTHNNYVVPLECIYRLGAPRGSSLFKTIKEWEAEGRHDDVKKLLANYGLTEKPKPGDLFPITGYDFTTKFEAGDRKVTDEEAFTISGLSKEQFQELTDVRARAVGFTSSHAKSVGMVEYDGKHEYVFRNGILVADVLGTLDECREFLNNDQVSKEFLRQYHEKHQPELYADVQRAKKEAKAKGIHDWKSLLTVQPKHLEPRLVELVGEMYQSAADRWTGLNLFNVRPLEQVMDELRPYYPN